MDSFATTVELAAAIRQKEISSEEAVSACLARIDAVNDRLNAVIHLTAEQALDQARAADAALARGESVGPLHGVPMTLKDSLDTAGVPTRWGSAALVERVPQEDATVVARLKRAGAILLGKTNTSELTLSFEANNIPHGLTVNPYDTERIAGGSSGGAAAIVAAGGSPFDIGSDTGGSIRLPAHFCGIAGIRPTTGRVPRTGHAIPFGGLLDALTSIGPLARTVGDLSLILPIIAGPDWRDFAIAPVPLGDPAAVQPGELRCAFFTDNGVQSPSAATAETVRDAARALSDAGAVVEEILPPPVPDSYDIFLGVMRSRADAPWVNMLMDRMGADRTKMTYRGHDATEFPTIDQFTHHLDRWDQFRREMLTFMEGYDLLISPVNADVALPPGVIEENLPNFSYTMMHNLTGWPAAVVRGGTAPNGLPIGVQVAAAPWREDVALAGAACIEEVLGGWQSPPL